MNGKWPAPKPESELRSFENLAPEPLKFSRLHQPWCKQSACIDCAPCEQSACIDCAPCEQSP